MNHSELLPSTATGVSLHTGPTKRKVSAQASKSIKGPHKIPRRLRDYDPESQSPEIHTARIRVSSTGKSSSSDDNDRDDLPAGIMMGVGLVDATNNHGLDENEEPVSDGK